MHAHNMQRNLSISDLSAEKFSEAQLSLSGY